MKILQKVLKFLKRWVIIGTQTEGNPFLKRLQDVLNSFFDVGKAAVITAVFSLSLLVKMAVISYGDLLKKICTKA